MTEKPDKPHQFQTGNELWRLREPTFGPVKIKGAQEIIDRAVKYFEWAADQPIVADKILGGGDIIPEKKPRPFLLSGFYVHAQIPRTTWYSWRKRDDDLGIACAWVEAVIEEQKLGHAMVNVFNANLVARDLGISDKSEVEQSFNVTISGDDADL